MAIRVRRPDWPHPEPDANGIYPISAYFEAIGRLVVRWNSAERLFQALVKYVAEVPDERAAALLTHVGSATLSDALASLASAVFADGPWLNECLFTKKLFEINRENRNFVVHCSGPVNHPLHDTDSGEQIVLGQEFSKFTARGKLQYFHYYIPYPQLRAVCEEVLAMNYYISELALKMKIRSPLSIPEPHQRPPLPQKLQNSLQTTDLAGGIPFPSSWGHLSPNS
jgi:hypothetical protein